MPRLSFAAYLAAVSVVLVLAGPAGAQGNAPGARDDSAEKGDPRLGFMIAKNHCARCHAVEKAGVSPLPAAPPFRDLHLRYPVEQLTESLGEGIRTGHPKMPEFRFDPDKIDDFIAYLKTLEQ